MEKERIQSLILVTLVIFVIIFLGFFAYKEPAITGFVAYEEVINIKNWTFDGANDYVYDDFLINLSDGEVKLTRFVVENSWSADNFTDIFVISALEYEPGKNIQDRTSKIQSLDSQTVNIYPDKEIFDATFDGELDNTDIISMHIKPDGEDDVEIYLCNNGTSCSRPGYGLVDFDENGGWYNITIANMDEPKNSFNIKPSKKIKFDYIKAVHIDVTTYSSTNISYPESASIETNDIYINGLSSFLDFYKNDLLNEQDIIYHYSIDSGNNWNNIPDDSDLSGISTANGKIRIKAEFSSDGSATPIISDFGIKYMTQVCNEDWNATYGACLSDNTKLKYYADKNECGTITNLPDDNGTYESCNYIAPCNENWNLTYGACLSNDTRIKYYVDKNYCDTTNNLPIDNGAYGICDYCSPNWSCISYGECQLNNFKKCIAVEDNNLCYDLTNLSSDAYFGNYNEFSLSCVYNKTGTGFSNLSISAVANEKLIINKTNSTDAILELNASNDIENNFVSIIKYSENKKNTSPSLNALNKYLDIEANNSLKNSINSVKIKIYYTDEEINIANLDEETLKIYYFNETNNQWQPLDSTLNSSGNYIEVTLGHLSTFGIFGEEIAGEISGTSGSSSSSGSSGGGGGGGTRRIPKTAAKPVKTETMPEKEKTVKEKEVEMPKEAKEECDYKISVSLPEHVSFAESDSIKGIISNIGNCKIENLNIGISAELKDVIQIEDERIENIGVNKNAEFSLIKKLETSKASNLIQGFNIKIPEGSMETYSGSLTFNGLVQDQLAFEEKVNVKVDLLKPVSTIEIVRLNIPVISVIFLILLGLFSVYNYRKRKKNRKIKMDRNHTL